MYDRWGDGEPNNSRGNQNFLIYYNKPYAWDDIQGSYKGKGFIVEYQNDGSSTQPTPETCKPATLSSDFKLHIPLLHYSPLAGNDEIMPLSVDMKMTNSSPYIFQIIDYKIIK